MSGSNMTINDERVWTALLYVYPEYSIELQIHGFIKNKEEIGGTLTLTLYRIKMIVNYKSGLDAWDTKLNMTVKTTSQEQWINQTFGTKIAAEQHCLMLAERNKWGPKESGGDHPKDLNI